MFLMYVDESGDPGLHQYSSKHFILTGLIIHQDDWQKYLDRLKVYRKRLKSTYNLNMSTEIHAAELIRINGISEYRKISKSKRIEILKNYCTEIPLIFDNAKVISICLHKTNFTSTQDIQQTAWKRLIQRYDTYLKKNGQGFRSYNSR